MKLIKFISIFIFFILPMVIAWASEKSPASDKLIVEPYLRIRMAIRADKGDAKEVVNQIQNVLMEKGMVISQSKRDPVIEGRVMIETHKSNKVNPFGVREFTLHDVVLVLKDLQIRNSLGTILASYRSFNGFGSHEIESQAFADAAKDIVELLKETNFISKAAKIARRQDVFIKTAGKANREEMKREIRDVINDFMNSFVEELQLKGDELDELKAAIGDLAENKVKEIKSAANTIYINGSELNKITDDYAGRPMKASYSLYKVKKQGNYSKNLYKEITGVIIDARKLEGLRKLRLQRIYAEGGALVFGGKRNPNFNPLLHFESKEALLLSDFRVEVKKPMTVRAVGLTDQGHIIVSDQDADKILLANRWGGGRIFSEGRIFVLTGTD